MNGEKSMSTMDEIIEFINKNVKDSKQLEGLKGSGISLEVPPESYKSNKQTTDSGINYYASTNRNNITQDKLFATLRGRISTEITTGELKQAFTSIEIQETSAVGFDSNWTTKYNDTSIYAGPEPQVREGSVRSWIREYKGKVYILDTYHHMLYFMRPGEKSIDFGVKIEGDELNVNMHGIALCGRNEVFMYNLNGKLINKANVDFDIDNIYMYDDMIYIGGSEDAGNGKERKVYLGVVRFGESKSNILYSYKGNLNFDWHEVYGANHKYILFGADGKVLLFDLNNKRIKEIEYDKHNDYFDPDSGYLYTMRENYFRRSKVLYRGKLTYDLNQNEVENNPLWEHVSEYYIGDMFKKSVDKYRSFNYIFYNGFDVRYKFGQSKNEGWKYLDSKGMDISCGTCETLQIAGKYAYTNQLGRLYTVDLELLNSYEISV